MSGDGAAYPAINLTATIGLDVTNVANVASVSSPAEADTATGNNRDSDTVTIGAVNPDLTIEKTDGGPFTPGQQNATFTIAVRNAGAKPTSAEVVVTDTLPRHDPDIGFRNRVVLHGAGSDRALHARGRAGDRRRLR